MSNKHQFLPRQPLALVAKARKGGFMHDRRAARGGARNLQREFLDELDDDFDTECDSCVEIDLADIPDAVVG